MLRLHLTTESKIIVEIRLAKGSTAGYLYVPTVYAQYVQVAK